ncbi:unnamed protein product [Spirodela intermedia]|uniref:Uncharacterized protein n=1 Tax=Spirodela intermedia TaxID=51605 RepID=A0A7I8L1K2_SPIIN|nr:unnamed protein product [Spirodela intermedia]
MADLKQIHAQIIRAGLDQHVFVVGRIISFCSVSEVGSIAYAAEVFERMERPDGFLWNTIIRGLGRTGNLREAFLCYRRMREDGKAADNFTFSFLLKTCAQTESAGLGKQVHGCAVKEGLDSHPHVRNTLIHMYAMSREVSNTIIGGYVHSGEPKVTLGVLLEMQRCGFPPDEATLVVVLSACSELGALDFGRWVHSLIDGSGLERLIAICNSLIDMYAKCGEISCARELFAGMAEKNVVSWNSMILGLAAHGSAAEALDLFAAMQHPRACAEPNAVTFLGVLCACSRAGLVEQGRRLFDSMTNHHRIAPTIQHYGCMADLLARAGLMREAYKLVVAMPIEPNAVVWRTLLAACRVHGDLKPGERIRWHLLDWDPDHSGDYVLLSHMYAGAGGWEEAPKVRESMEGRGVEKPAPGTAWSASEPLVNLRSFSWLRAGDQYSREDFNGPEENGPPLDEPAAMAYPIAARNIYRRPIR